MREIEKFLPCRHTEDNGKEQEWLAANINSGSAHMIYTPDSFHARHSVFPHPAA